MLRFAVCGAGRIGRIHATNIALHPQAELVWVVDAQQSFAQAVAQPRGANYGSDLAMALGDVDVVLIASPTPTHVEIIHQALDAKKAILCEKPVDLEVEKARAVVDAVRQANEPFMVGFNRRFDPDFSELRTSLKRGDIGDLEMVVITSRDPSPPPPSYIHSSGGLFRDMMIHDFDMARWLIGENPVEVFAAASNLVDPAIGEQGDVDTAMVTLKSASGVLVHISNSRRATYGYDQRLEVFGSKGMLRVENRLKSGLTRYGAEGVVSATPESFFLERYQEAYRRELHAFINEVHNPSPRVCPDAEDGYQALVLAEAALQSLWNRCPVRLP